MVRARPRVVSTCALSVPRVIGTYVSSVLQHALHVHVERSTRYWYVRVELASACFSVLRSTRQSVARYLSILTMMQVQTSRATHKHFSYDAESSPPSLTCHDETFAQF